MPKTPGEERLLCDAPIRLRDAIDQFSTIREYML